MNKPRTTPTHQTRGAARGALLPVAALLTTLVLSPRPAHAQAVAAHLGTASIAPVLGANGKPIHWAISPVIIELDATVTALAPESRAAIRKAFDAWSSPTTASLPETRFVDSTSAVIPNAHDHVNTIVVAPLDDPRLKYAAAFTTFYTNSAGEIVEADIILNSAFDFGVVKPVAGEENVGTSESAIVTAPDVTGQPTCALPSVTSGRCGGIYDIENIVTHEAGHFFGLPDDFSDPASTMYFCSRRCEVAKRVVSTVDSEAVETGYHDVVYSHETGYKEAAPSDPVVAPSCTIAGGTGEGSRGRGALSATGVFVLAAGLSFRRRARRTSFSQRSHASENG